MFDQVPSVDKMRILVLPIFLCLLAYSFGAVTVDYTTTDYTPPETDSQRDLHIITYIHNFKEVMANYVNDQYKNLTEKEMDKVKDVLTEFLITFATDLRETIEGKNDEEVEEVEDGISNATFEEIKGKIFKEFPEIEDETANLIIQKLRKNMYATRHKLRDIISNSKTARMVNSP